MKVRDVMSHGVVGVSPSASIKEAVRLMERHGVSGLPVVEEDGSCVGVLSEADLLLKEVGAGGLTRRRFGWLLGYSNRTSQAKVDAVTVGQAMSSPPIVASPDDEVRAAARLMVERHINRLPVVQAGQLVGIITRADVARMFARADADLEADARRAIRRCTLGSEVADLDLSVREGVVHAAGHVENRSLAEVLESVLARIDGVVASDVRFTWHRDDSRPDAEFDPSIAGRWIDPR